VLTARLINCTIKQQKGSQNTRWHRRHLAGTGGSGQQLCDRILCPDDKNPKGGDAYVNAGGLDDALYAAQLQRLTPTPARRRGSLCQGGTLRWCQVYGNVTFIMAGGHHVANNAAGLWSYCRSRTCQGDWLHRQRARDLHGGRRHGAQLPGGVQHSSGSYLQRGGLYVSSNAVPRNCTVLKQLCGHEGAASTPSPAARPKLHLRGQHVAALGRTPGRTPARSSPACCRAGRPHGQYRRHAHVRGSRQVRLPSATDFRGRK